MPIAPLPPKITKPLVSVLLGLMFFGGAAMLGWGPAHSYDVTCTKAQQISCAVERATSWRIERWQVALGTNAAAAVRVVPTRRGRRRVLLYLNSGSRLSFAAEFEGGTAVADAQDAAATLNRVFASGSFVTAKVEARPPSYLGWISWGALAIMGLLVSAIYRELFTPHRPSNVKSEPAPVRGAA